MVNLPQRAAQPREWNLWDLERLARAEGSAHPERRDEWSYLFVHLRQFANADGELPREFDSLVRDSFGGLLERQPHVERHGVALVRVVEHHVRHRARAPTDDFVGHGRPSSLVMAPAWLR